MSASLVGSEMCIRDRGVSVAAREFETRAPNTAIAHASQEQPSEIVQCCHCLLYTSDAADDM
eukprot:3879964-Alexandrium_andersonii.AAC.1